MILTKVLPKDKARKLRQAWRQRHEYLTGINTYTSQTLQEMSRVLVQKELILSIHMDARHVRAHPNLWYLLIANI